MPLRVLLLGSGELGKELTLACQAYGLEVVAVDHYPKAPAMQVADFQEVGDIRQPEFLDALVDQYLPQFIIPELDNVNLERLQYYESQGIRIPPSAAAIEVTANRKVARHFAAKKLKLQTPNYLYASNLDELILCVKRIGLPCVVKSMTSSSGKGQSVVRENTDIEQAWLSASDYCEESNVVLVEEFIEFDEEITLLAVSQANGPICFCPPIGQVQSRGDYQESWQPAVVCPIQLTKSQAMATEIIQALGGNGLWAVEFFVKEEEVYFSEISAKPHDTALVTLAGTQSIDQFKLYVLAMMGEPVEEVTLVRPGASAVILTESSEKVPEYEGLEAAEAIPDAEYRIFGKPLTRPYRRMGVGLAYGEPDADIERIRERAREVARTIKVN